MRGVDFFRPGRELEHFRDAVCYMQKMHFFTRESSGRLYRVVAQSVWDSTLGRSVARQVVLGPAEPAPKLELSELRVHGQRAVGDVGALLWVAEQLDVVGQIDRACPGLGGQGGPSVGELVLAVAVQRACSPGSKRDLAGFLEGSLPRVSCLPAASFTGQAFHRLGGRVGEAELDAAQVALARAAVERFELSTSVLAFDTTNFDTHIATTTPGELAKRGHAKSKRRDLRVVGLGVLVSETGHVPLFHRTYAGNASDQSVLESCLDTLGQLHDALDAGESREKPAERTLVRDGGFWREQLELDLDVVGYYSLISLPLSHSAALRALEHAAKPGAMTALSGPLREVRAARMHTKIGDEDRTLVVVSSPALLEGQKRGIAAALAKAKKELGALEKRVARGKITRVRLEQRVEQVLRREHLADFVVTEVAGEERSPSFAWRVDPARRRHLERTRLGKRVICTDRHTWRTERIVAAFRGQWNVEELFRRAKKGGVVPWGPSYQWADSSLRLHTFATVLGLMLVALAKIALGTRLSARAMMRELAGIRATIVRPATPRRGRPATYELAPAVSALQARAVGVFELARWMPALSACRPTRTTRSRILEAA